MALLETLVDDFTTNQIATLWPGTFGAVAINGGTASVSVDGIESYAAVDIGTLRYDLLGSSFRVKMTTLATTDTSKYAALVLPSGTGGTDLMAIWQGGTLTLGPRVAYGFTASAAVAVAVSTAVWISIGEGVAGAARFGAVGTAGTTYFFTSPNGVDWTLHLSTVTTAWSNSVGVSLQAGSTAVGAATVVFDDVNVHSVPAADTAALTDTSGVTLDASRPAADSSTLADDSSTALAAVRAPADAVGMADAIAIGAQRTEADSLVLTDALIQVTSRVLAPADTLALTDAATAAQATERTAADSLSGADAVTKAAAAARVAADTVTGSDTVSAPFARFRAPADTATVSDAITIQRAYAVTVADASGMLDSASYVFTLGGVLRDLVLSLVPAENRWATRRLDPRFELNPAAARLLADAQADPYKIEPLASRWGLKGAD